MAGVRVRAEYILKVKAALGRNFDRQADLAERLGIAESTVWAFLNGKRIRYFNFLEICHVLGLDLEEIADPELPSSSAAISSSTTTPPSAPNSLLTLNHLEYPDGAVPLNSPFYIERQPIEQRCDAQIQKSGSLIRIKSAQQMGKSSLLVRILQQAEIQGDVTVTVDFQFAPPEFFSSLDVFLRWLCASVTQELTKENQELEQNLLEKLRKHWDFYVPQVGSMIACRRYFESYLFREISQPVTLALETVDRIFEYPSIYKEFFALLRALHEEAQRRDVWKKLRLIIVYSTEAYVQMDVNKSPFNVGLSVELPEFTPEQIKDLAQRHQLNWSNTEIESLTAMVGGHPFLICLALYKIASREITLPELLQTASTETGIYSNHLRHIESILKQQPELEAAMKQLLSSASSPVFSNKIRYKLRALGLVKLQGDEITLSCELYRQYFQSL